ncbi:MAG: hypothetical protein GX615_01990 [Lentisphaerae bacterium]|nr:hypothetical protein [Lentisphaerota bacterium]
MAAGWRGAFVRLIGQECGYTKRGSNELLVPSHDAVEKKIEKIGITPACLDVPLPCGIKTWDKLVEYFTYRADLLRNVVEPNLMDATQAKKEFTAVKKKLKPKCPLPMNKQKGKMRTPAYLTCLVNMLIEAAANGQACDYDPRALTTVMRDGVPLRTFARRMDGAFPSVLNPLAVWEIKEYYYTTTFGSRVADGVYETLLDGMEVDELAVSENVEVLHYLIIDARYTWWDCGKSYLCRIIDMLHMGYVDEVLVGREILTRLPILVNEWCKKMP